MNNQKNKRLLVVYSSLLAIVVTVIGITYAYFRLFKTQKNQNEITTRNCLDTSLTENSAEVNITDAFPISDNEGMKLTPYTFTVTNNCDSYVKIYITLKSIYKNDSSSTYLKDDFIKANLSQGDVINSISTKISTLTSAKLDSSDEGYILKTLNLKGNQTLTFNLRLWMDQDTTIEEGLNKIWQGKIVIVVAPTVPNAVPEGWDEATDGTILASIRDDEDNNIQKTITIPGKEISAHTVDDVKVSTTATVSTTYQKYYWTYGTGWEQDESGFKLTGVSVTADPYSSSYSNLKGKYLIARTAYGNSSSTASVKKIINLSAIYYVTDTTTSNFTYKTITSNKNSTEDVLASTKDDYGTSLYFRGSVDNNYVEFANKCWRIVRVTGNGAIKLILHNDNVSKNINPCLSSNNNDTAAFAHYSGSTYNTTFNSFNDDNAYVGFMYGTASSSNYANTHKNTNKSQILTNLETWYKNNLNNYEEYLEDVIWCNDKKTSSDGIGYGTSSTDYFAFNRLGNQLTAEPSLICQPDNDGGNLSKFTTEDTTNGNGALTYKIGLLTADEAAFAGASSAGNNAAYYLQENTGSNSFWTLSPYTYSYGYAYVAYLVTGKIEYSSKVNNTNALRPVIALKPTVNVTGKGTSENPYIIN